MSGSKDVAIRRCACIKRLLFLLCRFPTFSSKFIREHIDKPDTELAELEDYESNCATASRFRSILLVGVYFVWIFKNAYIVWIWLSKLDFDNYANKLQEAPLNKQQLKWLNYSAQGATLRHLSCLVTNCTRLGPLDLDYANQYPKDSSERLAEDVSRLPLVSLCDRWFGQLLYGPAMTLDALGISGYAITIYAHLLLGAWTTIQQMLSPASSDTLLFVTSPKVTTKIKRLRARQLLNDLSRSYQNFQLPLWRRFQKPILAPQLIGLYFKEDQEVSNCMPSVRTHWWRERLARLFFNSLLGDLIALAQITFAILGFFTFRLKQRAELYDRFEHEMNAMQCNIWLDHVTAFDSSEAFRLGELNLNWTATSLLETIGLSLLGGFTVALLLDYYWCIVLDLDVWLAEFRMLMVASLAATRFQHERQWFQAKLKVQMDHIKVGNLNLSRSSPSQLESDRMSESMDEQYLGDRMGRDHFIDTRYFYKIRTLRQQFQESIILKGPWLVERIERLDKWQHNTLTTGEGCPKLQTDTQKRRRFSWHRINSKHKDRFYNGRFLAQMLFPLKENDRQTGRPAEHFDKTDFCLDTMEQIYINSRLLCEHVNDQPMGLMISITYLLNYGLVLICIILRNRFPNLELETKFIIVFASLVANFLIILAADFHAQAKKLQPLLWSLIAQLTLSKSLRAQHMRSLWLKLAIHFDNEGGLAMKAFGISVSYIFIIQLMIWTTTILALALKQRSVEF